MPNNDFSPTGLNKQKVRATQAFGHSPYVEAFLRKTPVLAPAMIQMQANRASKLLNGDGQCVGIDVTTVTSDDDSVATFVDTSVAGSCLIGAGRTLSSQVTTYNFNLFNRDSIDVSDSDCGNFIKEPERLAQSMASLSTSIVQGLNVEFATFLEANKATPQTDYLEDDITIVAGDYTITGADYWNGEKTQELFGIIKNVADLHGMSNYFMVTGRALRLAEQLATWNASNMGIDRFGLNNMFNNNPIIHDLFTLDATIGAQAIFLIDPSSYIAQFMTAYDVNSKELKDPNNTVVSAMPLMYYNQYQEDNRMAMMQQPSDNFGYEPVMTDIRLQRNCDMTSDPNGKQRTLYRMEYHTVGMLAAAPNDGVNTGIVKFVKA